MSELEETIREIKGHRNNQAKIKKIRKDMKLELYSEMATLQENYMAGVYSCSFWGYVNLRIKKEEEIINKYQKLIKNHENK